MTTTPTRWKSQTKVNTADDPAFGGASTQTDAQVIGLPDGGYYVVWTDYSRSLNPNGTVVLGQQYDILGNKVGGETRWHAFPGFGLEQSSPAITVYNGGTAVAYVDGGMLTVVTPGFASG